MHKELLPSTVASCPAQTKTEKNTKSLSLPGNLKAEAERLRGKGTATSLRPAWAQRGEEQKKSPFQVGHGEGEEVHCSLEAQALGLCLLRLPACHSPSTQPTARLLENTLL